MKKKVNLFLGIIGICFSAFGQVEPYTTEQLDSIYIANTEDDLKGKDKVLHAEPLYIDLIRDLGARKGEKEWNFGFGLNDKRRFDNYEALVEYEFAPIDRLGFEFELPFSFFANNNTNQDDDIPNNKLESLKLATQWSFFVNEKIATSMALGYINEFEMSDFKNFGKPLIRGNVYNPFYVVAKRWGNNFHTLIYTGPMIERNYLTKETHTSFEINSNVHFMIPGTKNFLGIEFNKEIEDGNFGMTIRPQMRVGIADNLLIGIVTGIPINKTNERLSSFFRLIWEPGHKHHISKH